MNNIEKDNVCYRCGNETMTPPICLKCRNAQAMILARGKIAHDKIKTILNNNDDEQ